MFGIENNNLLLRVISTNTLLVVVRTLFSILTQKILAVFVGPEGLSIIGNLKNLLAFLENFSIIGASNGLIKYVSQLKENKKKLSELFSTIFVFSLVVCVASFLVLFFFSEKISESLFGLNKDLSYLLKLLALILPFLAISNILNALVNGLSDYRSYTKVALLTAILGSIAIISSTYFYGLSGSLLSIALIPLIQFLAYSSIVSKNILGLLNLGDMKFRVPFKKELLSYSVMSLIVILFINLTDILLRDLIEDKASLAESGYWTAMNSISKNYMQFSAALFPLYILPQYSKINNSQDFKREVIKIYKTFLPFLIIGMFTVYLFRELIINILYTKDFLIIAPFFKWQLLGDFVKFIAIVISYQFLAKKQIFYFVFTELISVGFYYLFSFYFINDYGTEGVVMAHFFRYVLYLIVVCFILKNNFLKKEQYV